MFVGNALGSGVLESAAWLGFLPAIAERLLGERLILPSVATWWCGERPAFESVIANLENLVIKPTFPDQNLDAVFGSDLDAAEREASDRAHARAPLRLRRAGAPGVLAGAGLVHEERGPLLGACARHPRLRDRDA